MPIFLLARHHLSACRPRYWSKRLFFAPAPSTGSSNHPKSLAPDESKWCARNFGVALRWWAVLCVWHFGLFGCHRVFKQLDATTSPAEPPGPKWLRRIFGDDFFEEVEQIQIYNDQANDDTVALIAKLPRIRSLIVRSNAITDKGVASLAGAGELEALELSSANVTASGYANLKGLRKLMAISFRKNPTAEDSWLAEITKLTQVQIFISELSPIQRWWTRSPANRIWATRTRFRGQRCDEGRRRIT
jgi:hypothetical protein